MTRSGAAYLGPVDLFDGTASTLKRRHGVLIEDGRIAWVGPHARAPRGARGATALGAPDGAIALPGLFDCHVHLCWDGDADFVAEGMVSDAYAAIKAAHNAVRHLEAGVTTVRDLGAKGPTAIEVGRAIADGRVPGPRVIAAGWALTCTAGHGHTSFAMEVDGPQAIRGLVRAQVRTGARAVKVVATGGVLTRGAGVDFAAYAPEELAAAVEEGHRWNLPVAAHAHGEQGVTNAVQAGVDSVEHGSVVSAKTARLMKERGTVQVPTLGAHHGIVDHPDRVPGYVIEKGLQVIERARESFRTIVRNGVRQAVGTDAGTPFNPHGGAPLEITRMVELGLSPSKALLAATSVAARLCRLDDETGTLEPGKAADLVLYEANPLDDIRAVLTPAMVLKAGRLVNA